jgi:predicted transcriptional regulator of viral defense system
MGTSIQAKRIALLAQKSEQIFHIKDLGVLWGISDSHTLRVTLKRYADAGLLHRIYRGFYATFPLEKLDAAFVGAKALHGYCYLSTETILYREAYLSQKPHALTFVSDSSKKFIIVGTQYLSRQLKPQFLFNPEGIVEMNGLKIATPERAIADLLYFNPLAHFDRQVNWKQIQKTQKAVGYPLTPQRYVAS